MPFAGHSGAVPGGAQGLGDRWTILAQIAAISRPAVVVHHVTDARLMGIKAGHQRGTWGTTASTIIERGEARTGGGECVDMRCFDLRSVAANVGKAEIVGQEDDNIRAPRRLAGGGKSA